MNLKDLVVDVKEAEAAFPGLKGFNVLIANLSRKELTKLRKKCTTQKFNRKTHIVEDELNEDKFVEEFSKAVIKGWSGLTLEHLSTLILIDTEGQDLSQELPYSQENAELLISSSGDFDSFINDTCYDIQRFSG